MLDIRSIMLKSFFAASETVDWEPFSFTGILLMAKTSLGTGVSRIKMSMHLLGRVPFPCRRKRISLRCVS